MGEILIFTIFYHYQNLNLLDLFRIRISEPAKPAITIKSKRRIFHPESKGSTPFLCWASEKHHFLCGTFGSVKGLTADLQNSRCDCRQDIFFAMEFFRCKKRPKLSTFWRVLVGKFLKCWNSWFYSSLPLILCQIGRNLAQKWMPGHLSTCAKIVFRPALQSPGGSTRELLAQQLLQCAACLLCWDLHLKQMKRLNVSTKIRIRMLNQVVDANLRPTKKLETLSTWRMFHHPCWMPIQKVLKQNKVRLAICILSPTRPLSSTRSLHMHCIYQDI